MKERFIFGYLKKEKRKKGIKLYWSGKFFTKDKFFTREYATKPGTMRAIISLQKRGIIPRREYFITKAQRGWKGMRINWVELHPTFDFKWVKNSPRKALFLNKCLDRDLKQKRTVGKYRL